MKKKSATHHLDLKLKCYLTLGRIERRTRSRLEAEHPELRLRQLIAKSLLPHFVSYFHPNLLVQAFQLLFTRDRKRVCPT